MFRTRPQPFQARSAGILIPRQHDISNLPYNIPDLYAREKLLKNKAFCPMHEIRTVTDSTTKTSFPREYS